MGAPQTRISTMVVAVACAAAVLTGCTGGDDPPVTTPTADASSPKVTASPSASPSVTASPTPSSTVLTEEEVLAAVPADLMIEDFPSAAKFTEFFLAESQDILRDHDSSLFRALADDSCEFCSQVLEHQRQLERDGIHAEGGELVGRIGAANQGLQTDGTWVIDLPIEVEEMRMVNADGTISETVAPEQLTIRIHLSHSGSLWQVLEVAQPT